ncbi:MAG: hypothetical protein AB7G15_05835 [Alphaproteobacteria bacterium]
MLKRTMIAAAMALPIALAGFSASAEKIPDARIKAILAMSPQQMAETGAWTKTAYDKMLGHIRAMKNQQTRDLLLDMVLKPESKAFKAKATQSFLASPAAGGRGHHFYPGGLPVHVLEWIEVAMAWADSYERIYKVQKLDRDMIVASLVLHDWAKVWYEWDPATAKIAKPKWFPDSWGGDKGKAKWKWMGEHGTVAYAELITRGAPDNLVVATAASHFDPHWDLDKEGEGLNPALAEAAKVAGKPPIVVKPGQQMTEWWFATYTDGAWSYSHYIAAPIAHQAVDAIAEENGFKSGSPEANRLAWFVLTRVSDFRIYEVYQAAGFKMDAAKDLVRNILKDSAAYEVKK